MVFLAQPTLMVPNKIKKQIKQIENNLFIGDRVHPSPHQKGLHDSNSIKFLHLDSLISVFIRRMPDYESTILLHNLRPNVIKCNYVDGDNLVGRILPTP